MHRPKKQHTQARDIICIIVEVRGADEAFDVQPDVVSGP